ncbi:hypothetical protein F0562_027260 [Nyssa sinensis]|uniref:Uncharacterized protein n=1 Tax=Nyssa sinensis TaxID=561372 RepID=A0A5J5B714_9ASTE|nr:hypothetical protein F0562_027260 [Nyssa sinensis]
MRYERSQIPTSPSSFSSTHSPSLISRVHCDASHCHGLRSFHFSLKPSLIHRFYRYELDSTKDLSLQRHFWTLHVGLVGALPFQYFGNCVDVVYFLQWVSICLLNSAKGIYGEAQV